MERSAHLTDPFSANVGHEAMKRALALVAVVAAILLVLSIIVTAKWKRKELAARDASEPNP